MDAYEGKGEVRELDLGAMREQLGTAPGVRRPFTAIDGDTFLAIEDNNPFALDEAHPDKSGNAIISGQRRSVPGSKHSARHSSSWRGTCPTFTRDGRHVTQIIPVGTCWRSTCRLPTEKPSDIYMTLPPSP